MWKSSRGEGPKAPQRSPGVAAHGGWRIALLGAGLLTLLAGAACDSDSIAEVEKVEIAVEPGSITFPSVALNETATQTLFVTNKSTKATAKLQFELLEEPRPGDRVREFGWSEDTTPDGTVEVKPNETIALTVTYTPQDTIKDSGKIIITHSGNRTIEVPVDTSDLEPDIAGPARIIFGRVPAGGTALKRLTLQNEGRAPLKLERFEFGSNAEEFSFCFPQGDEGPCLDPEQDGAFPEELTYLETLDVRINYNPSDDGEDLTVFQVYSNDPDERPFEIDISANGQEPCILVSDETGIDFVTGFIGGVTARTVTITNCSPNKDLEVSDISMLAGSDEAFFVDSLPGNIPDEPLIIPVDGTASFVLNYAPEAEVANEGTLEIRSNDTAKDPLHIPVNGRGSNNACPTAVAKARIVGSSGIWGTSLDAIPLDTIAFDASDSTDPDDPNNASAIQGYEWTVVERPADSTAQFSPNARSANPQFFLDLAGRYVFELRVYDANNTPSCETSQITVLAVPNEDIHVQLVWDTPGDPNQTDSGVGRGTDLDLHVLNPNRAATWNASPWDCYWLNVSPNWGSNSSSNDDPSLDIDDTDGAGPENINLNNPEDLAYRVGVYYFDDHGYGPSYATIRIYLRSTLVFQYRDKYLERTGQFWEVGTIDWSGGAVSSIDRVTNSFP